MKEIIYNYDYLSEEDITEVVVRIKVLLINNRNILLGNERSICQFPGGHLEEGETFEECLKREIKEETGIDIENNEIEKPFMKVSYFNKDYPTKGVNRKSEIYYYAIKTSKTPNLEKVNYTDNEKAGNFRLESIPLNKVINILKDNIPNNEKNKVIAPDMIMAIEEYLKK